MKHRLASLLQNIGMVMISIAIIFPIAVMLHWAFSGQSVFSQFQKLFAELPIARWLFNSLFISGVQTLGMLIISSLGGYALAKHRFAGKKFISVLLLMTLLLPGQVLLPGLYQMVHGLGLINTYTGVIVPMTISVFGLYLFRQAMLGIPDDLLDAARVDGCSELRIWWTIALPMVKPMIGAFTLLSFIGSWNVFIWPGVVLQEPVNYTLPLGLANLVGQEYFDLNRGVIMAAVCVSLFPVIMLFAVLQRDFISGLWRGAFR